MKKIAAGLMSGALLFSAASAWAADAGKSQDFATGNMSEAVKGMDANGDGMISKDEYMSYAAAHYDKDHAKFATGNMTDAVKAKHAAKRDAYLKTRETKFEKLAKNTDGLVTSKDMVGYLRGPGNK